MDIGRSLRNASMHCDMQMYSREEMDELWDQYRKAEDEPVIRLRTNFKRRRMRQRFERLLFENVSVTWCDKILTGVLERHKRGFRLSNAGLDDIVLKIWEVTDIHKI